MAGDGWREGAPGSEITCAACNYKFKCGGMDLQALELYADHLLLVINKPAGLLTLPDGYDPTLPHVKSLLIPAYGPLWIVHRLDKETSGVLLLARTAEAHRALNTQFEQHQVTKIYHALAMGEPAWEQTMAELPLRPNGDRRHRTVVDLRHGKPALTHLRILQRFPGCALLEARPETGRTHQIRAHLAALGFPLAGDALYGTRIDREGTLRLLPRPALHAWSLMLIHPGNRNLLTCTAPYPADFSSLLEALQKIG